MKKKYRIISIALVLLASFYLFSKFVRAGGMEARDFAITVKVQDRMNRHVGTRFDGLFEDIGFFASPIFSSIAVVGITILMFIKMKRLRKVFVLIIPLAFGLLVYGEIYGKSVVHHPAPQFFMIKNPTTIFPKYYINEEYSYPSGHAARAVFIGVLVSSVMYQVSRKKRQNLIVISIAILYGVAVSVSRIYLGHHWMSDVIGGWLLGSGLGLFSMTLL